MSTEVSQVPEYLKQYMDANATGATAAAAASSSSVPRVSTRGRQFRFIENGEEVFKTGNPVEVIILGVEPETRGYIKTFYIKQYSGADSSDPPDCSSMDGIMPSPWINNPQHANCAECPKNAFGSAKGLSGKPSKACKDSKRIWLKRADKLDGPTYGMNITVSSLPAFAAYARLLMSNNVPFHLAITKLTMADAEYPQVEFEITGYAKQENVAALIEDATKKAWVMPAQARTAPALPAGNTAALPGAIPDYIKNGSVGGQAAPAGQTEDDAAARALQSVQSATINGEAVPVPDSGVEHNMNEQLKSW